MTDTFQTIQPSRTAFFISDGTGITAEGLGRSLLAQFDTLDFKYITIPYVDTKEKAQSAIFQIEEEFHRTGKKPIVIDTVVDREIRTILAQCTGFMLDIFSTFLQPLEQELNTHSSYTVGKSHSILDNDKYKRRMDAIQFAMDNDDGAKTNQYDAADLIIIGVSRSGKTPSCIFLALQYGLKAANYPITEEDLSIISLPKILKPYRNKLFGLSIDIDRLTAIRNERRANSRYASLDQCEFEVRTLEQIYQAEKIPFINSTHLSVEEISTKILTIGQFNRKI
jgi:regulator of PEP synthase PpsR (kinase-PPPase family)